MIRKGQKRGSEDKGGSGGRREVREIDEREPETNSHFTLGWKIKED